MEKSKRLEYRVGIFVALGLAAAMASILALGGSKKLFTQYINIKARFAVVQGLFPGSVVSLAGMPVGNVKKIGFAEGENSLLVTMQINKDFASRLVEGSVAEINTQGALGDKYVYITPGPLGGKPLEDGAELKSVEVDYLKMLTSREDGVARVIDLIKDLQVLVHGLNSGGKLTTTVNNISEISGKFVHTVNQINSILDHLKSELPENKRLRASLASLASILEKVDKGQGTLGQLINDPAIHQSLKAFLGGSGRNRYMKEMLKGTIQKSDLE